MNGEYHDEYPGPFEKCNDFYKMFGILRCSVKMGTYVVLAKFFEIVHSSLTHHNYEENTQRIQLARDLLTGEHRILESASGTIFSESQNRRSEDWLSEGVKQTTELIYEKTDGVLNIFLENVIRDVITITRSILAGKKSLPRIWYNMLVYWLIGDQVLNDIRRNLVTHELATQCLIVARNDRQLLLCLIDVVEIRVNDILLIKHSEINLMVSVLQKGIDGGGDGVRRRRWLARGTGAGVLKGCWLTVKVKVSLFLSPFTDPAPSLFLSLLRFQSGLSLLGEGFSWRVKVIFSVTDITTNNGGKYFEITGT
ncbi:hypothetical protein R6Q59_006426 [Mikania micrantha]